jgi:hypothetical protein
MLKLLAPIPPRLDWPAFKGASRIHRARPSNGSASGFQMEHLHTLHAALVHLLPDVARRLDPTTVKTRREASAFIAGIMTALRAGAGYA